MKKPGIIAIEKDSSVANANKAAVLKKLQQNRIKDKSRK